MNPPKKKPEVIPPRTELLWYGVDFDGTIAQAVWRPGEDISNIGDPIWENVEKLRQVAEAGYKIIIHTARSWSEYENLEHWLKHYDIPYKEIQCGKPLYRHYVDDRAIPADAESWLKEEETVSGIEEWDLGVESYAPHLPLFKGEPTPKPRTWSLPPAPGPEVTDVYGDRNGSYKRQGHYWVNWKTPRARYLWHELFILAKETTITDATHELEEK